MLLFHLPKSYNLLQFMCYLATLVVRLVSIKDVSFLLFWLLFLRCDDDDHLDLIDVCARVCVESIVASCCYVSFVVVFCFSLSFILFIFSNGLHSSCSGGVVRYCGVHLISSHLYTFMQWLVGDCHLCVALFSLANCRWLRESLSPSSRSHSHRSEFSSMSASRSTTQWW